MKRPGWWGTYVSTTKAKVAKRPIKRGSVKAVGTARVGKKLSARTAGWGPKPVKIRYQWLRDGRVIRGATKVRYTLRKADRGAKVRVRVTVTKPKHLKVVKLSKVRKVRKSQRR